MNHALLLVEHIVVLVEIGCRTGVNRVLILSALAGLLILGVGTAMWMGMRSLSQMRTPAESAMPMQTAAAVPSLRSSTVVLSV